MWNKELVKVLIKKYQEHENLYDVRHPKYLDRVERSNSLFEICQEIKKINKEASVEDVKKKIQNLRSQYLRELRGKKNSKQTGVGAKLWCFRFLKFLSPHCQIREPVSNILNLNEESTPNSSTQNSLPQLSSAEDDETDESLSEPQTLSDPIRWKKDSVLLLISNYKQHKGLYDSKHNLYHKKKYRNWALNDIAEKLQGDFPEVTVADIKSKIHYLRAQFSREQQKVYDSIKTAICDEDIYKPSAYWYKDIKFIKDYIKPRRENRSLEVTSEVSMASGISETSEQFDESSIWDVDEVQIPTKQPKLQQPSEDVLESASSKMTRLLNTANDLLTEIAKVNKPEEKYNDNLVMFLKENIKFVTDPDLKDDMTQKIIAIVLEYKKKQRNLRKQ